MYVAKRLKNENIAEYLLYMWQVEDLLRACHSDIDEVAEKYLARFSVLTPEQQQEQRQWYSDLCNMMHSEGVIDKGHLQICKNVIANLQELHVQLIASDKFPYYHAAYYDALPAIVELREKSGEDYPDELTACFNLLYGIMLLRMQNKTLTPETERGLKSISAFISMLAGLYHKNLKEPIDWDSAAAEFQA
ncbi:MAG: DUF4924 family protein [Bacteroidaceae bacterium]|nr:DUF4924 family protein [Bacteroidaceae bacterium]